MLRAFPAANVPVVPFSIQHHGGPQHDFGSGVAIATSYAQRFSDWVAEQLSTGQMEALLQYRRHHADAQQAHAIHRGIRDHVLAMDSYAIRQRPVHF